MPDPWVLTVDQMRTPSLMYSIHRDNICASSVGACNCVLQATPANSPAPGRISLALARSSAPVIAKVSKDAGRHTLYVTSSALTLDGLSCGTDATVSGGIY
ncbi:hypothetical protein ZHAS_00021284 [Anopheles sinensis]|uniref:Uncharacterized protein n=1 Tax=Anopheles sinensis TaxID=74873 RepID=A0A084WRZ8_ANOSI|nr:hypothetical protein ZHAS_00021284 [Anopheles sinensis]